jgi:hypothetical protein
METIQLQNDVFLPQVVELINEGHTVTIMARGNSMMPFIKDGRDSLIFSNLNLDIRVGEAVLAEIHKGVFVCHRIVEIKDGKVTLRGDGNVQGTETCRIEDVKAQLVAVKRCGKYYDLRTSKMWKIYSFCWTRLLPLRRYLLALYRLLAMHQLPQRWQRK